MGYVATLSGLRRHPKYEFTEGKEELGAHHVVATVHHGDETFLGVFYPRIRLCFKIPTRKKLYVQVSLHGRQVPYGTGTVPY